jgi:hypothetical protein
LTFDGVDDSVTIADTNALDLTTGLTLEAWVYPTASTGWRTVLLKEASNELAYALYSNEDVARPTVWLRIGNTSAPATGTTAVPLNSWTHLATTYDGAALRLFVNGVQVRSVSRTGAIVSTTNPLRLGGNSVWGEYFAGRIDDVRIYNRALTSGEIQLDMGTPVPPPGPPRLIITTPTAGSTVSGPTVSVTYAPAGPLTPEVDHVHFKLDGGPELMDLPPIDGSYSLLNVGPGPHVLDGFYVRANHSKIPGTDATAVNFTATAPDTVPPSVSISAPAPGATLSGSVTITAGAADDIGVAGVQFKIDNTNLGPEDTQAPYTTAWTTTATTNGPHSITAAARDTGGNLTTSAAIMVTVSNGSDPSLIGRFDAPFELGTVAVHMAMLHTGSVLFLPGQFVTSGVEKLWHPSTGTFTNVPNNRTNLFCSAHVQLADGRILFVGGHDPANNLQGSRDANIFDPVSRTWTAAQSMTDPRWYPSATTLADGRVLALSGGTACLTCIADVPELYDPRTNTWTRLTGARLSIPYYPFPFLLPDGRIVDAGANEQAVATRTLNVSTQTWTMIDPIVVDGHSAAMYRPGQILKTGTAGDSGGTATAAATAYVIDMNQASPTWRQVSSMSYPRAFQNSVILPTGDVLVTGGGRRTDGRDVSLAVREAELWSPTTETWRQLATAQLPRLYHSSAVLLPDGRVLTAGGGNDGGATNFTQAEIFNPPYLFQGSRPTITQAPSLVQYGSTFVVDTPDAANISAISLIRPGATTHAFDQDQRFLNLSFERQTGRLVVHAPQNANFAPPGYYMLFLLSGQVPSVAEFVRLPSPAEDGEPPSAPSLSAQGGLGTATLAWTASTDNTGVAVYNVHRAGTTGLVPTIANRVVRTNATSYVDAAPSGTYYYVVTAEDTNGNISTPSNEASAVITGDTNPPSVSITNPGAGATVSATVQVRATAADNIGVAGVQFELDGLPLGPEDMAAPFEANWVTTSSQNGAHTLTALARDPAGNQTRSAPVSVTVSNIQAQNGLVAAYSFNELAGTSAADSSGNGNTGQLNSATWSTAGRFGGALQFNGTNSVVSINDAPSLDLTSGMTLEAWVNPTQLSGWKTVVLKERSGDLSYALYAHDEARPAGYVALPNAVAAAGTTALPLNSWTHVAFTYDGSSLVLFINGLEVRRVAATNVIATSTGMLRIGGNAVWGEYFTGFIDEVRIYNRALTAGEVQIDMSTPLGGS